MPIQKIIVEKTPLEKEILKNIYTGWSKKKFMM